MLPRMARQINVVPPGTQSKRAYERRETERDDKHSQERGSLLHR
jgi:hypothetical protein